MATLWDRQTQESQEVPDDKVPSLVASGRFSLPKGRVAVESPDGDAGTIDVSEAQKAFAAGYRFRGESEVKSAADEKEYGSRPVAAAGAGAARSLSLGLSDLALTKTGLVKPETLKGLEEHNKAASLVGEGVGMGLGLLTGAGEASGIGLAARAGRGVEAALAETGVGKLLAKAGAGAAENAFWGAGSAVSEASLGDTDLSAEKLLSSAGVGALLGAGGNTIGHLIDAKVVGKRAASMAEALTGKPLTEAEGATAATAARATESAPYEPLKHGIDPERLDIAQDGMRSLEPFRQKYEEAAAKGIDASDFAASGMGEGLPIRVNVDASGKAVLTDGRHRLAAAQEADAKKILSRVIHYDADGNAVRDVTQALPLGSSAAKAGGAATGAGAASAAADVPLGKSLEKHLEESWPRVKGILDALDIEVPTKEGFVLRDLDLRTKGMRALENKDLEKRAPQMLLDDARYAGAKKAPEKLELIRTKQQEAADAIGTSVSRFDALANRGERLNPSEVAERIRKEVAAPLESGPALNRPILRKVLDEAEALEGLGDKGLSFMKAEELKRSYDPFLKWDSAEPGPVKEALRKVRGIINDEIEKRAEAIAARTEQPELAQAWKQAKREYGAMAELGNQVEFRQATTKSNRFVSPSDYAMGALGLLHGGPAGVVMGVGGALLNKWGRERLPHVLALYLQRIESSPPLGRVAEAFQESIQEKLQALPTNPGGVVRDAQQVAVKAPTVAGGLFGQYGGVLANAAARGAQVLFATHAALMDADPAYRHTMVAAGYAPETPQQTAATHQKLGQLGAVQSALDEHDKRTDAAVKRFFGQQAGATPKAPEGPASRDERLQRFHDTFSRLAGLVANPNALMGKLQPGQLLSAAAPGVAAASASAASRAAQFLYAKAPKNPNPDTVPALERPWQPSDSQLASWDRTLSAVSNPQGVLADLKRGTVTQEAVEALGAVYPKLLQDIRQRMTERLAQQKGRLEYAQKRSLSVLFGQPVGGAGNPASFAVLQSVHQQAAAAQAQAEARANAARNAKFSSAGKLATTSQQIEGRGVE